MKAKLVGLFYVGAGLLMFKMFPEDDMTGAVFFIMFGIPFLTYREEGKRRARRR